MYPSEVDKFIEKLNKVDSNTYVIEEEVELKDGMYEDELKHDNVSNTSVRVYTGPKLTGDKIENFILSTPSLTPWKRIVKIFSSNQKVYITYETQGDTIEAEDINKVQESILNTQIEVDRYKSSNDLEVGNLKVRAENLENNKSEKTYVETELNKRYLKTEVYTKSETDNRIQGIIGSAPTALDTLQEIAKSLNNDEDFAGTMVSELAKKVDKATGKQLSTEDYTTSEKTKLAGIETGANKYIHPSTHPANIIVEDSTHRFSSDAEKTNWNDANSKKHAHNNLSLLETITQTLVNAWNSAYTHISDAVKHITSAERNLWNTVSDKSNIGHAHDDRYYTETEANNKFVSKTDLGNSGYGDMLKSTYDTNGNGIVDKAESSDTVDGFHASQLQYKDGTNYYALGAGGSGLANIWYKVFTWTVFGQYDNIQAEIKLNKRGSIRQDAVLHIRGEYGSSTWQSYESYITGYELSSEDTFLLAFNNATKTVTLYYKRSNDWNLSVCHIISHYLSGANCSYINLSTGSAVQPSDDILLLCDVTTRYYPCFTKKQTITWNNLKGV